MNNYSNVYNKSMLPQTPYGEFEIVVMLTLSTILLIYMMTFIERDKGEKLKIDPYTPFLYNQSTNLQLITSPSHYYVFDTRHPSFFSLKQTETL
jgi:hypothetical protein